MYECTLNFTENCNFKLFHEISRTFLSRNKICLVFFSVLEQKQMFLYDYDVIQINLQCFEYICQYKTSVKCQQLLSKTRKLRHDVEF